MTQTSSETITPSRLRKRLLVALLAASLAASVVAGALASASTPTLAAADVLSASVAVTGASGSTPPIADTGETPGRSPATETAGDDEVVTPAEPTSVPVGQPHHWLPDVRHPIPAPAVDQAAPRLAAEHGPSTGPQPDRDVLAATSPASETDAGSPADEAASPAAAAPSPDHGAPGPGERSAAGVAALDIATLETLKLVGPAAPAESPQLVIDLEFLADLAPAAVSTPKNAVEPVAAGLVDAVPVLTPTDELLVWVYSSGVLRPGTAAAVWRWHHLVMAWFPEPEWRTALCVISWESSGRPDAVFDNPGDTDDDGIDSLGLFQVDWDNLAGRNQISGLEHWGHYTRSEAEAALLDPETNVRAAADMHAAEGWLPAWLAQKRRCSLSSRRRPNRSRSTQRRTARRRSAATCRRRGRPLCHLTPQRSAVVGVG